MVIDFSLSPIKKAINQEISDRINECVADVEYSSSAKTIYFYNGTGDTIATVDASDFIIDGMIENVTLSGNILTIIFNTDAGKQNINIDLTEFINPQSYYTSAQTDNLISSAYTSAVTTSNAYTDDAVSGVSAHLNNVERVTSIALNELRTDVSAINLADAVASAKTYTDAEILSARTDASAYTNSAFTSGITYVDNAISALTDHIGEVERITAIAIDNINDEIENFVTSGDVQTQITTAIADKVSSTDVVNIVKISQSDYDAMSAHSSTTLYVIE